MEKVIKATRVSCPNEKFGCKENASYGNPSIHEKQCLFARCMRDCNYTGSYKDLYNHVRAIHKDGLIRSIWHISFVIEWDLNKTIAVLDQEKEDGKLIVVQFFGGSHGLTVSVSCIAPLAPRLHEFSCTLKFATSSIRLKQALLMKNIQKVGDAHPQDNFILIPSYVLPSDGSLKMEICISRGLAHLIHS